MRDRGEAAGRVEGSAWGRRRGGDERGGGKKGRWEERGRWEGVVGKNKGLKAQYESPIWKFIFSLSFFLSFFIYIMISLSCVLLEHLHIILCSSVEKFITLINSRNNLRDADTEISFFLLYSTISRHKSKAPMFLEFSISPFFLVKIGKMHDRKTFEIRERYLKSGNRYIKSRNPFWNSRSSLYCQWVLSWMLISRSKI